MSIKRAQSVCFIVSNPHLADLQRLNHSSRPTPISININQPPTHSRDYPELRSNSTNCFNLIRRNWNSHTIVFNCYTYFHLTPHAISVAPSISALATRNTRTDDAVDPHNVGLCNPAPAQMRDTVPSSRPIVTISVIYVNVYAFSV